MVRNILSQKQGKLPFTTIIAGMFVTAAMLSFAVYDDLSRLKNVFLVQTTDIRDSVQRRINAADEIIHSLATLYSSSTNVDADQFRMIVEHVLNRHHYFSSVMYLPRVTNKHRKLFEESLQDYGFVSFSITEKNKEKDYVIATARQVYFPIQYHEPLSPVSSIQLGYDINSDPNIANAISQAIDNNIAVAALPFEFQSDSGSYVLVKALYSGKSIPSDKPERRQTVNGLLAIHVNMKDILVRNTDNNINNVHLDLSPLSLSDETDTYNLVKYNKNTKPKTFPFDITSFREKLDIELPGQKFVLEFRQPIYWSHIDRLGIFYALIGGLVLSTLFIFIVARTRAIAKEKELREKESRILKWNNALTKLAKSKVIETDNLEMALREIVETATENINIARSSIWLYSEDRTYIYCVDLYEPDNQSHEHGRKLYANEYPAYFKALKQGRVISATNALTHSGTSEFSESHLRPKGITSVLNAPFRIKGQVAGVVCFEHKGQQREWTPEEQNFSASMADMAAMAIQSNERKKVEVALRDARDKALAAEKTMSSFLANMSHEIRTPLTAIIGFSQTLLDSGQTMSERVESIDTIIKSGKHLLHLINDILDLSKIEESKLVLEILPVSIFELLHDIKLLVQHTAEKKGINLSIEYNFPLPITIHTDQVRVKQILLNLVTNAIKFTSKGSVCLRVNCLKEKQLIEFNVIDTGIGLNSEQIGKLFNPFTQADNSTTRKFGGTGLGLYLSKQLAEQLDGTITVDSIENEGSCFTASVATGDLEHIEFVNAVPELTSTKHDDEDVLQKMQKHFAGNVLLVDDNENNQKLISLYLRKMGATVTLANNGEEGMNEALNDDYDLVLMDMQMPVMDGLEATKRLRDKDYSKPIIALTANTTKDDQRRYLNSGCNGFLSKPVNITEFYNMVSQYLTYQETQQQPIEPLRSSLISQNDEMAELVDQYIQLYPGLVKQLRQAFEERDWDTLKRCAHDLKATGGSYGFIEITETAKLLEFELCKKNELAAAAFLDVLDNMHKRMCI